MMELGNLKAILYDLYKDLDSKDPQVVSEANSMINTLLHDCYDIHPLTLFLYDIRKKDCVQNIKKLLIDSDVSDFAIAKALSSLVTHLIIATEKDPRKFQSLLINDVISLLSGFVGGTIDRPHIIEFFTKYL